MNRTACATFLASMSRIRMHLEKEVMKNKMREREAKQIKECVRELREQVARDVTVEDVKTMKLRVLIYDVPSEMSQRDVLKELCKKISSERGVDEGTFARETNIVFRTGKRHSSEDNMVMEGTKGILDRWLRQERVYVGLRCLKVRKYEKVLRCYNSCGYGHMKRDCERKSM